MVGFGGVAFIVGDVFSKTIVIKVGGSCLANGRTIKTVVDKINQVKDKGIMPVVVISALKGMTDALLDAATNSHAEPDSRVVDGILSEGEQLSVRIMHSALENAGVRSKAILLSDPKFPIITDDQHGNANILLEETEQRIRNITIPIIEKGVIPIIPGFVGRTKKGAITTMGRGSSDTTAIVVGKALKAREVILLKDVPGILSGLPEDIDSPKKLSKISIEETLNLGIKGGKVLCPVSLTYKPKEVKVRIVNFDNGDILEGGTEITGELEDKMKVEINKENKAAVTVVGNKMSEIPGLLAEFSNALFKKGINISSVSAANFSICFYVDMKQHGKALEALHDIVLKHKQLTTVTSMLDISLITIAGKDFAIRPGVLGKIGTALAKGNINIIDISTSVCEADILVDNKDAEKTKQLLEGLF